MYDMNTVPLLFVNNLHVGLYVRELIDRLIAEKAETFPRLSNQKVFVDEAVYTKNRNFRTFLSSKYGKNVVLKKATEALTKYEDEEFFHKVRKNFVKLKYRMTLTASSAALFSCWIILQSFKFEEERNCL